MTSAISYASKHHKHWADNDRGLDEIIEQDVYKTGWHRPYDIPQGRVTNNLRFALVCAYAGDSRRAGILFQRAVHYADRLQAEERLQDTSVAECGYPLSLGEVTRDRAYARWLLGEGLDQEALRQAAAHITSWCLSEKADEPKPFQCSITMDQYLGGVRLAIASGDLAFARKLLAARHKFLWFHAKEKFLWTRFVDTLPNMDGEMRFEIERFFDLVRDPDFKEIIDGIPTDVDRDRLAIETGMIRQMYLINQSPSDPVDPQVVIEAVSY